MQKHDRIVCPGCTCLCDDISVSLSDLTIAIGNACERGAQWFESAFQSANETTQHQVSGKTCDFETAIKAAATILLEARAPLICEIQSLAVPAQQLAWKLADLTAATIDSQLHDHGRGSMYSLQKHGKVTASLGEIANRSDLVVFWFCDPESTHPRHLERYSRPAGRAKRKVIVVDEHKTATAHAADQFLQLPVENAAALLMALRGEINDSALDPTLVEATTGWSFTQVSELAQQLVQASYGGMLYGHTSHDSQFDLASDQLALLIRDLNDHTRFVGLAMRSDQNGLGAENVLAWSSGYPFATNYSRQQPHFFGQEYSAKNLLERAECDAVLLGGSTNSASPEVKQQLSKLPTIQLSTDGKSSNDDDVLIHISAPGMDDAGDYCRQDNVPLPLKKLCPTDRPSASNAIQAIFDHVGLR